MKVIVGVNNLMDEFVEFDLGEWCGYDDGLYDLLGCILNFKV